MRPEAVHLPVVGRDAPITEQPGEHVRRLGRMREEVPDVLRLLAVGERVRLLGVDEVGELQRIPDEEDRHVIAYKVVIAVGCVELDREPTRVTDCLGCTPAAGDRREPHKSLTASADPVEHRGLGVGGHVAGDLEVPVGARTSGVHDSLRDPLPVEPGKFLEEVLVLQQHRAVRSCGLGVLVVGNGCTGLSRENATIRHDQVPLLMLLLLTRRAAVSSGRFREAGFGSVSTKRPGPDRRPDESAGRRDRPLFFRSHRPLKGAFRSLGPWASGPSRRKGGHLRRLGPWH